MIKKSILLWLIGVALFLTGCGKKNSEYLPPQSEVKSFPESSSPEIPEVYRRQGYEMYRSAVSEGYDKVSAIVDQYLNIEN